MTSHRKESLDALRYIRVVQVLAWPIRTQSELVHSPSLGNVIGFPVRTGSFPFIMQCYWIPSQNWFIPLHQAMLLDSQSELVQSRSEQGKLERELNGCMLQVRSLEVQLRQNQGMDQSEEARELSTLRAQMVGHLLMHVG